MRRTTAYPLTGRADIAATLVVAGPASAHGYASSPPSRQAPYADGTQADRGDIRLKSST
ncbi:hypothetical protein OHR68_35555 [Spirillospora sp. NBC_00431]